jgi:hypothetical protein
MIGMEGDCGTDCEEREPEQKEKRARDNKKRFIIAWMQVV